KTNTPFRVKNCIAGILMLAPAVILCFLFILLPMLFSLGYAFTDYNQMRPDEVHFVGFNNFKEIFKEIGSGGDMLSAIKNTAIFVVGVVPLQILLALGLALFCSRKVRGSSIFKVCFFAPVVISLTVTSYLWLTILDPSEDGLFNMLLGAFGIPQQQFLKDPKTAMLWVVLISAWQGCGYQMLIFISGLTNIREDLYEAAKLDGANAWQRFIRITVPGLKSSVLYITITVFIGACRIMVQPMLMIGPYSEGLTLSYYMFLQGTDYGLVGKSSAIALLMTIFIGLVTFVQKKVLGKK
ncbi:MAG: sugar ABC transporter permease, partial [Clostridia bacterium]|nr:sugar ABC transporter permease [Clostridia bacterium]